MPNNKLVEQYLGFKDFHSTSYFVLFIDQVLCFNGVLEIEGSFIKDEKVQFVGACREREEMYS